MPKKIILASKSPRRSQLLTQAGIPFEVRTADTEEIYPEDLDVLKVAPYLAKLKADGAKHLLKSDEEVLLTADSVVILAGKIYGKPVDRAEAIATLGLLSGNRHTVVTGCCLLDGEKHEVFAGVAEVYLNEMTTREIEKYVDAYQPYDKAGSYAIQEWVGLAKINRIEGTYPTIMGLPVDLVYSHWMEW
ncbi:Maf family protein [Neolewinella antarctica]|uniref:dTTP/UTP pyrophosphatase n=1 Tax=Neolewinella antarctica TaxID=442734 RepID=A0ABX0XAX7_9BACT|nr:Maf family protein [Neolewinella antarctica]NJC26423.1 septum formation protein [Neolewinella antarctica]